MLQEAVEMYIGSLTSSYSSARKEYNRNTILAYQNDLHQLCSYLELQFDLERWSQVTHEHIAAYIQEMHDGQAYRPTTIARKLAALKAFFRYLCDTQTLASTPIDKLESPRVQKDLPQVLTAEQIGRLLVEVKVETFTGQRDLAMLHMLYSTGMRVTELMSLNVNDFNKEHATILCPGRNGRTRRERVLPLPLETVEVTQRYLAAARPRLVLRHPEERALFVNHHGERLTRQGFWLIVKGYARLAGIEEITPHMLRHSFALLMLNQGKELRSVQELLGHAHISATQIYTQLVRPESTISV